MYLEQWLQTNAKKEVTVNNEVLVLFIIIVSGGLGGLANYLTTDIENHEERPLFKRVVVGAIAAVVVPAFLNLISSSTISDVMSSTDYFVFAGFCLLAGFSSKAFLTSMSKGLVDRLKSVEERQSTLESEVDPIVEKETELDDDEALEVKSLNLSENDQIVLAALGNPKYTRRYLKGIVAETNLDTQQALLSLEKLKAMELVRHKTNNNSELFWLTQKGRKTIRDIAV